MTIRMLQAWNGYPQQAVVSMSSSEENSLVGLGIASFDLDGPAENVRMAQLATDAAGDVFILHPSIGDDFKLAQPTLLFESGAGFSRRADGVADTTKIILCRVPLPKSRILNNCTIRVTHYWTFTSSGQTKNLCLGVDDTAAPSSYFVGSTSTGNAFHGIHELIFRGDKVSVIAPNQNYASGQSSNAPVSLSTKDFNEDRELVFYAYWNALSSGEWIELTYLKVEVQ
jgi:hypothetical protein